MAADRAAELTEAYRILSDEGRRAEYDRARGTTRSETAPANATAAARAEHGPRTAAEGPPVQAGARHPRRVRPQSDGRPFPPGARRRGRRVRRKAGARIRHLARAEKQDVRTRQGRAVDGAICLARGSRGDRRRLDTGVQAGAD